MDISATSVGIYTLAIIVKINRDFRISKTRSKTSELKTHECEINESVERFHINKTFSNCYNLFLLLSDTSHHYSFKTLCGPSDRFVSCTQYVVAEAKVNQHELLNLD